MFKPVFVTKDGELLDFSDIDIIPIPWNVPFPVKVIVLWSTLSAAHWQKPTSSVTSRSSRWIVWLIAECLYLRTSPDEIESPNLDKWFTSHLDPNVWSNCTLIPNGIGQITGLLIAAWVTHFPRVFCLILFGIRQRRSSRDSGIHLNQYREFIVSSGIHH